VSLRVQAARQLVVGLLAAAMAQGAWAADDVQAAALQELAAVVDTQVVTAEAAVPDAEPLAMHAAPTAVDLAAVEAADAPQAPPMDIAAGDVKPPSGGGATADGVVLAADEAAGGSSPDVAPPTKRDPFESFNRKVYGFNEVIDNAALRPLAEGYRRAVPELARTGVDNFFGNLADVWSAINKLLQGKVMQSAQMTLRVATNTVFGLGGLLDPATEFGLERQPEDFGQTLGTWGVPSGPYLVLPILGPSTVRDTAALPLDRVVASPSRYLGGSSNAQLGVTGVQLVAARAGLLSTSKLLGEVALDKYSFLRDAYLARRRSQLYDGNPPDEEESTDPR
jgi:phospholipid-binding lipoprotein MlaA